MKISPCYVKKFASKIVRPLGTSPEVEALIAITENGGHQNIVTILSHGRLPASDYHFIDMELCDLDLNEYIDGVRSNRR